MSSDPALNVRKHLKDIMDNSKTSNDFSKNSANKCNYLQHELKSSASSLRRHKCHFKSFKPFSLVFFFTLIFILIEIRAAASPRSHQDSQLFNTRRSSIIRSPPSSYLSPFNFYTSPSNLTVYYQPPLVSSSIARLVDPRKSSPSKFNENHSSKKKEKNNFNRDLYNKRSSVRKTFISSPSSAGFPKTKDSSGQQTVYGFNDHGSSAVPQTKSRFQPPLPPPPPSRPRNFVVKKQRKPSSKVAPSDGPLSSAESSPGSTTVAKPELPVSRQCLSCLCNANTNCDEDIKCVLNEFCGPYLISQKYWMDAGKLGPNYKSCVMNKTCAEETVQNYMKIYAGDCNGDNYIDCDDFVAIHQLGSQGCKSLAPASSRAATTFYSSNYWNFYQYCYHLSPVARREYPAIERREEIDPRRFVADSPATRKRSQNVPKFTVRPITPKPTTTTTESPSNDVIEVASECLDCLCEASGCSKNTTCGDSSLDYMNTPCGPFGITYHYWLDAGREPDRSEFESCSNDKLCSRQIVTKYLNKFATDCNADGFIDCLDYVLIHKLGPKNCKITSAAFSSSLTASSFASKDDQVYDSSYWKSFKKCYGFGRR